MIKILVSHGARLTGQTAQKGPKSKNLKMETRGVEPQSSRMLNERSTV